MINTHSMKEWIINLCSFTSRLLNLRLLIEYLLENFNVMPGIIALTLYITIISTVCIYANFASVSTGLKNNCFDIINNVLFFILLVIKFIEISNKILLSLKLTVSKIRFIAKIWPCYLNSF
jgi:hypothetical protein